MYVGELLITDRDIAILISKIRFHVIKISGHEPNADFQQSFYKSQFLITSENLGDSKIVKN